MKYPPSVLDEIRARLPVSQVVGRTVPLKRKGREFAGLSPFKDEKTPSFFVNDQKGFYHCFASGEHGDIFTFLMKTEGLAFPEAVARLAEEAGVSLPTPERVDPQREEQRERWFRLLDEAQQFFRDCLYSAQGRGCLAYLTDRRELSNATIETFSIGYAPNSRTALSDHLKQRGFKPAELAAMGVVISGDDIPQPYDRFRNRAIFPIHDAKGRVIAFGGRALDADQPAKYLNSPETPLFHKGHQLYNAHRARKAAFDNDRVIVVEGYMDVVALHQAGVREAVAPLGTALTEDQVKLLWRMAPEPILCFDGDSAGRKAAHRAIDTAIHLLAPRQSLRFAFLPDGQDPDDLIKESGQSAIEAVLSGSRPFADILYEREWASGTWQTPEQRAQLETQLNTLVSRIEHSGVRSHYERDLRNRLFEAWRGTGYRKFNPRHSQIAAHTGAGRWGSRGRDGTRRDGTGRGPAGRPATGRSPTGRFFPPVERTSSLRNSQLAQGGASKPPLREIILIKALLNHPWLIDERAEDIARLQFTSPRMTRVRDAILSAQAAEISLDTASLRSHVTNSGLAADLDLIERSATHRCDRFAEPGTEKLDVTTGWEHTVHLQDRQSGLLDALKAAEKSWLEEHDEAAFDRIKELKSELDDLALPDI